MLYYFIQNITLYTKFIGINYHDSNTLCMTQMIWHLSEAIGDYNIEVKIFWGLKLYSKLYFHQFKIMLAFSRTTVRIYIYF